MLAEEQRSYSSGDPPRRFLAYIARGDFCSAPLVLEAFREHRRVTGSASQRDDPLCSLQGEEPSAATSFLEFLSC